MMTERGQWAAPGQAVLRVCRQRDNRWCLQFLGLTAASYLIELGFGRIGTTPWNDLVGVACYLGAGLVTLLWLRLIIVPFVTKGRLPSGITIQEAIMRRRIREERRTQKVRVPFPGEPEVALPPPEPRAAYLAAHPDRPHRDKPAHARPRYSRRQT